MIRPLKVGKNRYNSYNILPEPKNRKVVYLEPGLTGKDIHEYVQKQLRIKEHQKVLERVQKIEKIKSRINDKRNT